MNRSGIKRGLAALAISSLAVTGAPFFADSATAVPLSQSADAAGTANAFQFLIPAGTAPSIKNDGTDAAIRLESIGGANITNVRYEFSQNGGGAFTTISTVTRNDNGAFSFDFTPDAGIVGIPLQLRAVALNGATVVTTSAVKNVTISAANDSINVTNGDTIGVFQQPYVGANAQNVIVNGTTSAPTTNVVVNYFDSSAQAFSNNGAPAGGTATNTPPAGATTGTYSAILNIAGYDFSTTAGATDEILIAAGIAAQQDTDSEAYALYRQAITTVTATADRTTVATNDPTQSAAVTVTVNDQNGRAIAGARVTSSAGGPSQFTNAKGQATFNQAPDGNATTYYADATDQAGFQANLGDKQSAAITVNSFTATATTLFGASADGAAFDFDENMAGDITVQVRNQNGGNFDTTNQTLSYFFVVTPFGGGTPTTTAVTTVNESATPGRFDIAFPTDVDGTTAGTQAPPAGATYDLRATLNNDPGTGAGGIASSSVLTFKAGDSNITFDSPATAPAAGSSTTRVATLALSDGTPLVGRNVTFTFNSTGDAAVAAQASQPTGTTTGAGNTATDVTDATGKVQVVITDPAATPQTSEVDTLTAATTNTPGIGNAAETATTTVTFANSTAPAGSTVDITNLAGTATAGNVVNHTLTVVNGVTPVAGVSVALSVTNGFFTTPGAATTTGAAAGTPTNLGTSITVVTNANGQATFATAIGRDAGFDDDGLVDSTITATLARATGGNSTDTEVDNFTSTNPLNGGAVDLVLSPASTQSSTNLPKARVGEGVKFYVTVVDQFGNRVGGQTVTVTDNSPNATETPTTVNSGFDNDTDVTVNATAAGDVVVTATYQAPTTVFSNSTGGTTTGTAAKTDSETISFYTVDFANSVFTLTHAPAGTPTPGTAVTETLTVKDQFGRAVQGLNVQFIRSGPSDQGGDANVTTSTNINGQAFYSFTGTKAGTAQISAVVSDGVNNKTLTDTVVFKAATPVGPCDNGTAAPCASSLRLIAVNVKGGAIDNIRVRVTTKGNTVGTKLTLFRLVGGQLQPISTRTIGTDKYVGFRVPDQNGTKNSTVYVAKLIGDSRVKASQARIGLT